MKKIWAIIRKDTLIRFGSPVEWLFFIVLPLVFIFLISGGTTQPGDQRIKLSVVDQAGSPLSAQLLAELERSAAVYPDVMTLAQAEQAFEARETSAVLILPAGFSLDALTGQAGEVELRLQKNNLNAMVCQQAVNGAVEKVSSLSAIASASLRAAEQSQPFASAAERQAYFDQAYAAASAAAQSAPQRLQVEQAGTADAIPYDPRANSTAGQMITWVFIPLIGLAAMFAMERAGGTLRRLMVTPTSSWLYLTGTVLGQVLIALLQMTLLVIFGIVVMGIQWGHAPLALALVMVCSTLSAAALGTMLGTFVKTEGQANGIAMLTGMVMAMLGGCWYPLELFPQAMQSLAHAFPTYWAMRGFLDIAVRGQGLAAVWPECALLLGFALVFFGIGVRRFRVA